MGNKAGRIVVADSEISSYLDEATSLGWTEEDLRRLIGWTKSVVGDQGAFCNCFVIAREKGVPGEILHRLWLLGHHMADGKSIKGGLDLDKEYNVHPALQPFDETKDKEVLQEVSAMARSGGGALGATQISITPVDPRVRYSVYDQFENNSTRRLNVRVLLILFSWFADMTNSKRKRLFWCLFQIHGRIYPGRVMRLGRETALSFRIPFSERELEVVESLAHFTRSHLTYQEFSAWWKKGQLMHKESVVVAGSFGVVAHYAREVRRLRASSTSNTHIYRGKVRVNNDLQTFDCSVQGGILTLAHGRTVRTRMLARALAQADKSSKRVVLTLADGEVMRLKVNSMIGRNQLLAALISNSVPVSKLSKNRFESFHNEEPEPVLGQAFVDGADYFQNVLVALRSARKEILIADWSFQAELYLFRGPGASPEDRLDFVLRKKAAEGVHIYIMLWWEASIATGGSVNSAHVQDVFAADSGITVLRHPTNNVVFKWSHHQKIVVIDREIGYVGGLDLCTGRYDLPDHPLVDDNHLHTLFPGKDFYNPCIKPLSGLDLPWVECYDRTSTCRLPWHDVHVRISGNAAKFLAGNFVERWNAHGGKVIAYDRFGLGLVRMHEPQGLPIKAQMLRSLSDWSGGPAGATEHSILNAYLFLIRRAEHFIYIENQFFISSLGSDVKNTIADALVQRITQAFEEARKFRVVVVMPLHSEGEFTAPAVRMIYVWTYKTIKNMHKALHDNCPGIKVEDYLSFHFLLKHDVLQGVPFLNAIYVHSKLIIADDAMCVVGSANINDRSMLGDRDSEIAVFLESAEDHQYNIEGEEETVFTCSKLLSQWRARLWQEHLGVEDASNPFAVMDLWNRTSQLNSVLASPIVRLDPQRIWDHIVTGLPETVEQSALELVLVPWLNESSSSSPSAFNDANDASGCDCCKNTSAQVSGYCGMCDSKLCSTCGTSCATLKEQLAKKPQNRRRGLVEGDLKLSIYLASLEHPEQTVLCHLCAMNSSCPVAYSRERQVGGSLANILTESKQTNLAAGEILLTGMLKKLGLPCDEGTVMTLLRRCDKDRQLASALLSTETKVRLKALRGHVFPLPISFCPRLTPHLVNAVPTEVFI